MKKIIFPTIRHLFLYRNIVPNGFGKYTDKVLARYGNKIPCTENVIAMAETDKLIAVYNNY